MKLDLVYEIQPKVRPWSKPHPYGQREAERSAFDEAVAQIRYADALGYHCAWLAEHHFRDGRSASASPEVVLGGLALTTDHIRLGFGGVLMPFGFGHPARVAERVATVDLLSHGRVEWGTGCSSRTERAAFDVPLGDGAMVQWKEAVEIVVKMWEQERFSWDSPMFQMSERIQAPKPFQDPHPPCWLAVDGEASAFDAGKYGLGMMTYTLTQSLAETQAHFDAYRRGQAEPEPLTHVNNDRIAVYTLVHCYDDADEAAAYGLGLSIEWWYRNIAEFAIEWELPLLEPDERVALLPRLQSVVDGTTPVATNSYIAQDRIIVGTPDECLEQCLRYAEAGVDQLMCFVQFGVLPHKAVLRSIELLGTLQPQLERSRHRMR
ncbi:MAG: LLM class flavin-dependent oxidoreductase [Terracidiphilus sp.]